MLPAEKPHHSNSRSPLGAKALRELVAASPATDGMDEMLRRVADHSPNSVLITNTAGDIVYVNARFTQSTGYAREDVLGKNPRILKSGRLAPETYSHLWNTLRRGREWQGLLQNRRKNGEYFWVQSIITPIKNAEGEITHFLSVTEDVTARRSIEVALQRSEERMRGILEGSQSGYAFMNLQGGIEHVNGAWLAMHGFDTPGEMIGRRFLDFVDAIDSERIAVTLGRVLAGEKMTLTEYHRVGKDGLGGRNNLTCQIVSREGVPQGIEVFVTDITQQRLIEERYQMLFSGMLDGMALCELISDEQGRAHDCRFLDVNPAFEKATRTIRENIVGRTMRDLLPQIEPRWIESFAEVVATGKPKRFCDHTDAMSGKRQYFEVVAFTPEAGRFAFILQDVTTRRELEENLRQSQKMDAVGQLAGGIAHDFNNFLTGMMMLADIALEADPSTGSRAALTDIRNNALQAARLTQQLLVFSRRQAANPECIDLNKVAADIMKMLRCLIGENISMRFSPADTPAWVVADVGMMQQVLMNLCLNARDAMPRGGELGIHIASEVVSSQAAPISPRGRNGNFVRLTVKDNGCGMNEATLRRIFEPFFTTKEVGKGTGLGLATVFGIVEQHSGWIDVESQEGIGSTFHVLLPAAHAPAAGAVPTLRVCAPERSIFTILVVEDSDQIRPMTASSLRRSGYTVFEAPNSDAALALWRQKQGNIDVLLTDMVMPGSLSGFELAQVLKAESPKLAVVLASGYRNDLVRTNLDGSRETTRRDYRLLPKPYHLTRLLEVVDECVAAL